MSEFNFDFSFIKSGAPIVTLSSIGIAFNSGARSLLNNPQKVSIGYDEKANAIGIKPHNSDSKEPAYLFENRVKDNWVRISMKDFMKYLSQRSGINFISKAVQFIPEYNDDANLMIVIVDKEHQKNKEP